ncbi:MAG: cell division protein FtsQ/DivIB [Pseudomonadota bacterium]|nr:cell division protein FtsQ/DivIB [Pseudomonadota bacterium]
MSRVKGRAQRNSVTDRPNRLKLLLRRQSRFARPAMWGALVACVGLGGVFALHRVTPSNTAETLRARFGQATANVGLRVADVRIEGRANTPEPLLRAAIGVKEGDPILGFSVEQARERIEKLSWVEHATVERRLPGRIVVAIQERRPFAVWQNQGKFVLIDRAGQVVTNSNIADFRHLPLVVGPGAPEASAPLVDALIERPALQARVVAAVRVGERRWNLLLKSGMTVMLPEGHEAVALERLAALDQDHKLLERPLQFVDMRLPDRMVLRAKADAILVPAKDPRGAAARNPA